MQTERHRHGQPYGQPSGGRQKLSYRRGTHNGHTRRVIHIARHICIHKRQTQRQTHRGLQKGRHTEATT